LAAEELSEPPVASAFPPSVVEPFDFAWCVPPPVEVLPCACWARTCGAVVSVDVLLPGGVGAGVDSVGVGVAVVGVGVVAGASAAGAVTAGAVSLEVVVSVEVVSVEAGCEAVDSPLATAAGTSASTPNITDSDRITTRRGGRKVIGSALG
jgi:hypothetical protein